MEKRIEITETSNDVIPESSTRASSIDWQTRKPIMFYTSRTTPSCRAVKMVATHLQIPLEEINLRCYIDTRTEKFRKMNPCHTLPVIDDDGYILWESRAIMQYLCNQYAPESDLYPSDPEKRATVDRLLDFDLKTLSQSVLAVHFEFMFPSEYSTSRGEKLVAVTNALTLLEIFLINKNYVACNHFTIADISILANVSLLEIAVEFDLSSYPNIWLWINRLRQELPYYESLTNTAHDELRSLIQNVRNAHDEWSSPLPKCAFTPNGSDHSCIEEQRRQYKRLFSNDEDAVRIMAAVIPVFRNTHENNTHYINGNNHSIGGNFGKVPKHQHAQPPRSAVGSVIEFFDNNQQNRVTTPTTTTTLALPEMFNDIYGLKRRSSFNYSDQYSDNYNYNDGNILVNYDCDNDLNNNNIKRIRLSNTIVGTSSASNNGGGQSSAYKLNGPTQII